ncbi:hypothetical protein JOQ06_018937, partial [Pogonophryne albipinna]
PEDKLQGTVTLLREEQELQPEDILQGTVTLPREEQELQPEDKLQGTMTLLRESLSLQEVEIVEMREKRSHSPSSESFQQIKDELCQLKKDLKTSIQQLRGEVTVLQEDRDILKKEITAVKEELHLKHQTTLGLKEQLQSLTATASQRPQPATSNTQLTEPRPSTSSLLLQQPSSSKTSPNPTLKPFTNGPAPQHEPQPSTSYQPDNIPPSTIKITTDTEATDAESHPPRTRAIQARQASTTPINSRPIPGYQPCPPFQQPAQKSYATALKTPPNIGRNGADLGEITHLLSLICTKLMSQVV